MKLWKWQKGRQLGTNYWKFPLWYFRIGKWGFDAYILKYAPFSNLPWHKDPVDGKHWRTNIELSGRSLFMVRDAPNTESCWAFNPITFRPDLLEHKLIVSKEGCTKLSLGFVKFN